jgi:DNA gyrase subunit A
MIAIATSERNGDVVAATLVRPGDSLMLLTAHGHLVRTPVDSVRVVSRAAQGVTLIDVRDDKLVRITRVAEDDADGETPPDESGAGEVPEENRPPQNELAEDAAGQAEPGSDGSDR